MMSSRSVSSRLTVPTKSIGVAVRPWASWWDSHDLDVGVGQDGVERGGELSGSITDQEAEAAGSVVEVHEHVTCLLGSPASVGVGVGCQNSALAR
jgi:hypothetical protein